MLTLSPHPRALVGAARDVVASMIAPAADTEDRAAQRPAPAMRALAETRLLSVLMSAGSIPTTARSLMPMVVSGA